jgi:dTDP-glucose pyrophosphorylase
MCLRCWTVRPTLAIECDQARRFGVMAFDDTRAVPFRVQLIEKPR